MKVKVFDEPESEEPVLRLKLEEIGEEVNLAAVDEHGNMIPGGYILGIDSDGIVSLFGSLSPKLGLQLEDGHVKVMSV